MGRVGAPGSQSDREGRPVQGRHPLRWLFNKPLSRMKRSGSAIVTAAVLDVLGGASGLGSWVGGWDHGTVGLRGLQRAHLRVSGLASGAHAGRCGLGTP